MAYNNAIELVEEYGADSYRLVGAGFNFGFAQGYKQAQAEIGKQNKHTTGRG